VNADHANLKELKIASIKVGHRHRREMGDLTTLADSIRREGLLQPIGVTDRLELVFGERRLLAVRDVLKRKTILARVVNVSSILAGEYHENQVRKDFTPSERVAIARAVERQVGNRRGQRTDQLRGKIPEVVPGKRTREAAAEKAGFGNDKTYRQAAKVVANGTPPQGVLLDCFCGSGTMLCAGLDFGASQVIGIERQKKYIKIAQKRVAAG
jgi:ParB family chromosome partitioning protein